VNCRCEKREEGGKNETEVQKIGSAGVVGGVGAKGAEGRCEETFGWGPSNKISGGTPFKKKGYILS